MLSFKSDFVLYNITTVRIAYSIQVLQDGLTSQSCIHLSI